MAGISKAEREARAAAAAAAEQGGEKPQGSTGDAGGESSTSQAGANDAAALQAQAEADAKARAEAEAEALAQVRAEELARLVAAIAELPGDYTDADFVVSGMRGYFAEVFTDEHEAQIRAVVVARDAGPQLVHMTRDASAYPAPHTAEVHPDEVGNYSAGGWQIAAV